MDKKTTGIIATVATVLLCGCPGLVCLCGGLVAAIASQMPNADIDVFGSSDPGSALGAGIGLLCLGVIFIAIPIVVGVLTLKKKPGEEIITGEFTSTDVTPVDLTTEKTTPEEAPPDEPLPPAI